MDKVYFDESPERIARDRVPFLNAENPMEPCPKCLAPPGHLHDYGCVLELCPVCRGPLSLCTCKALIEEDATKTVWAIVPKLSEETLDHVQDTGTHEKQATYLEQAYTLRLIRDYTGDLFKGWLQEKGIELAPDQPPGVIYTTHCDYLMTNLIEHYSRPQKEVEEFLEHIGMELKEQPAPRVGVVQ